eukprot:SAG31_NODE_12085_length_970_cov_0.708381_1_plen_253_part_01
MSLIWVRNMIVDGLQVHGSADVDVGRSTSLLAADNVEFAARDSSHVLMNGTVVTVLADSRYTNGSRIPSGEVVASPLALAGSTTKHKQTSAASCCARACHRCKRRFWHSSGMNASLTRDCDRDRSMQSVLVDEPSAQRDFFTADQGCCKRCILRLLLPSQTTPDRAHALGMSVLEYKRRQAKRYAICGGCIVCSTGIGVLVQILVLAQSLSNENRHNRNHTSDAETNVTTGVVPTPLLAAPNASRAKFGVDEI